MDALPANTGLGTCTHDYETFYRQHFEDAEFQAAKGPLLNTQVLELQKIAEANYGSMIMTLRKELFPLEKAFVAGRPGFESDFAALYAKDKAAARKKLDAYIADAFAKVAKRYAQMASDQMP